MENYDNIIVGTGEIGMPLYELMTGVYKTLPIDPVHFEGNEDIKATCRFLHICIPGTIKNFDDIIEEYTNTYSPTYVFIHSTLSPGTTRRLNKKIKNFLIAHTPVHGKHKGNRMKSDMLRYPKYVGVPEDTTRIMVYRIKEHFAKMGFSIVKVIKNPDTVEWSKILSTTVFGLQIAFAQEVERICDKFGLDYDELTDFFPIQEDARGPIYPGFIGGHCLDGGEFLYMELEDGMIPITIREYIENDMHNKVLSYDKEHKKSIFVDVIAKRKRKFDGNMVTLTSLLNRHIKSTDEHLMMVTDEFKEIYAKDVSLNDVIPFINNLPSVGYKEIYDFSDIDWRSKQNMPDKIYLNEDFCRLLGYYIAEGSISNYGKGLCVRFSFNKEELYYIEDVCNVLESMGFNFYTYTQKSVTHVCLKSTPFAILIRDDLGCGCGAPDKNLPFFMYFASDICKHSFISGYFRGDGCFSGGNVSAYSVSRRLIEGLNLLLLSVGYHMSCSVRPKFETLIEDRVVYGSESYGLQSKKADYYNSLAEICGDDHRNEVQHTKKLWFEKDNCIFLRTTKKIEEEVSQLVYSIDTKNGLFVSTGGGVIHNCVMPNVKIIKDVYKSKILDWMEWSNEKKKKRDSVKVDNRGR